MNVYNIIILDESGSMHHIAEATIASMNEVLAGIRKDQELFPNQKNFVTIVTFEGFGMDGVKLRRDCAPIETISEFTKKDYKPGGCTPLFDAIGRTFNYMFSIVQPEDRVMATVITDGYENASEEYTYDAIAKRVGSLREKGWTIAYIGANQDAMKNARSLNIDNAMNFDATDKGILTTGQRLREAKHLSSQLWEEGRRDSLCNLFVEEYK